MVSLWMWLTVDVQTHLKMGFKRHETSKGDACVRGSENVAWKCLLTLFVLFVCTCRNASTLCQLDIILIFVFQVTLPICSFWKAVTASFFLYEHFSKGSCWESFKQKQQYASVCIGLECNKLMSLASNSFITPTWVVVFL